MLRLWLTRLGTTWACFMTFPMGTPTASWRKMESAVRELADGLPPESVPLERLFEGGFPAVLFRFPLVLHEGLLGSYPEPPYATPLQRPLFRLPVFPAVLFDQQHCPPVLSPDLRNLQRLTLLYFRNIFFHPLIFDRKADIIARILLISWKSDVNLRCARITWVYCKATSFSFNGDSRVDRRLLFWGRSGLAASVRMHFQPRLSISCYSPLRKVLSSDGNIGLT